MDDLTGPRAPRTLAAASGCGLALLAGTVIVCATGAWAEQGAGPAPIRSRADGRCLDADLGHIGSNGTRIQLWACNGWANQAWTYDPVAHTIRSLVNGRCLDADEGNLHRNGTRVQLWDCNGHANQQWVYDQRTRAISNLAAHRCLDADLKGVGSNGARIHLWDCNRWNNQKWRL
ncbi:RICIN domain-containing protein [Sphaerisporangium fuscum]|uniref:RICIN domain-containing protein n=1 Tax=Sphaerisporangium fuscum TaxID=2835868 RepID=UPI001BDD2DAB|nr:RICIN domain-containing protein [Sphaerisporangium fuscum]